MANYTGDTTRYVCGKDITSEMVFTWFKINQMKGSDDKRNIVLSTHQDMHVKICTPHIKSSCSEKLLGVKIDSDLNFEEHLRSIGKKASAKLNALARISPYIDEGKRWLIMSTFFQFPL